MWAVARLRAQEVTLQALIVALVTLVVVSFILGWAVRVLTQTPRPRYSRVEASLCGTVLAVENLGPGTVRITEVRVHTSTGWEEAPVTLPVTLRPGDSWTYNFQHVYDEVVLAGEGFEAVLARQECG